MVGARIDNEFHQNALLAPDGMFVIGLKWPSGDGQGQRAAGALYAQVKPQDANPARTRISRGTKSSNPLRSSGESRTDRAREWCCSTFPTGRQCAINCRIRRGHGRVRRRVTVPPLLPLDSLVGSSRRPPHSVYRSAEHARRLHRCRFMSSPTISRFPVHRRHCCQMRRRSQSGGQPAADNLVFANKGGKLRWSRSNSTRMSRARFTG
jgi:hypothetical protein